MGALAASRLGRLARRDAPGAGAGTGSAAPAREGERCELCGEPLPREHRHVVDVESRALLCACRACTLLLDHRAAGGGHFRLVPRRRVALEGFRLDDAAWEALGIPVGLAFFFHATPAGRVVAFYPGPLGAAESALPLDAWAELARDNPVLATLEPDVEALLVNRARGAREHWIVPVDDCYRLVAVIRSGWRGLTGGREVWEATGRFFEDLRRETR
ncbi:MAG TPA: DUF5947 family protein [Solirubrobacteraceae bacterium]|nr:DUF5947 family protein [Solirubrobacteraceae bacterium]